MAQTLTGTILGTVKDQSGAVLPGATVTSTNTQTGIARSVTTGARGEYRISALGLGDYQVAVTMSGFQGETRNGITLTVSREAVVDFALAVGAVSQQVTVTGEAPLVETTTATVSGLVDPQQIREIPLNARSFIDLVPLQAGATISTTAGTVSYEGFGQKVSISGSRFNVNSYLLDGARINDASGSSGSAAGLLMGVETVQEFKVVTNAYDAAYGNLAGGVISAVTKSGTNSFHGSLFEYLRNNKLDAPSFTDNAVSGGHSAPFRRNQFGGSIGGPVKKNKMFFFGSYEGLRQGLSKQGTFAMPGPLIRKGCLPVTTGIGAAQSRTSVQCYNADGTFTTIADPNQAVSAYNGVINPAVLPFMNAYPTSGNGLSFQRTDSALASYADGASPDGTISMIRNDNTVTNENYASFRIDNTISDKNSFFFRYLQDTANVNAPQQNGFDTAQLTTSAAHYVTLEGTHIFSPTLLARLHFSFVRTALGTEDVTLASEKLVDYKMPIATFGAYPDIPGILNPGTIATWGGSLTNPKQLNSNSFQEKGDVSYTTGRHTLKFGGDINRQQLNSRSDNSAQGQYQFTNLPNFFTNQPQNLRITTLPADDIRGYRQNVIGMFLQDDISVRPGLTLNLGLRYEPISVPYEVNGKIQQILGNPLTATGETAGVPYFTNPSLRNFTPRVGVAWSPFKSGKTSIRAGAGEFDDQLTSQYFTTSGAISPPFYPIAVANANTFFIKSGQRLAFPNAFTTQSDLLFSAGGAALYEGMQFHVNQPVVYKWSMSIQQQLSPSMTFEAGYSGERGVHLLRGDIQYNTSPFTNVSALNNLLFAFPEQPLPNPVFNQLRYRTTDGNSSYHGLLLTFTRRFSHGLQAGSSYTFAKSLDNGSHFAASGDYSNAPDPLGTIGLWGRSAYDINQSWKTNFIYDLPTDKLLGKGILSKVLGGWNISGLLTATSGDPVTPTGAVPSISRLANGTLTGNNGTSACTLAQLQAGCITSPVQMLGGTSINAVGPITVHPGDRLHYIELSNLQEPQNFLNDPALVNYPGAGRNGAAGALVGIGNIGPNTLTGPGMFNFDATLRKDVPISKLGEAGRLEIRLEMFNVANHTLLPNLTTTTLSMFAVQTGSIIQSGTAGVIPATTFKGNSRQIQLSLRVAF